MVRKMGDFCVTQRTKDSFFNATELLKQWNNESGQKKEMGHFFENKNTKEFINALLVEDNLKDRNSAYLKTRGKCGGTWMNPILFIKFAMWLNPTFEVKVIKFVYDNLIAFRDNAGDYYKELSSSVQKFNNCDFTVMAKGLNWIVFNKHQKGIRQEANESQLHELTELQKKLAFAIDMGYIQSFKSLVREMRKMWELKWGENGN